MAFWRAVERMGLRPAALLRQARLPATLHVRSDSWLTTEQYFSLWRSLAELTGDPAIGIRMVVQADTGVHPPAILSAFLARDYRDGLQRLVRFKRLCTPEELRLTEAGNTCTITQHWPHGIVREADAAVDVTFAMVLELGRRGTGKHIVPSRVEMTRSGLVPSALREYFGCKIVLGARRNAIVLDRDDLDRPFPGHNPELLEILTPALSSSLEEIEAQSSIGDQVKTVLKQRLASGKPDIAEVARELGMSERTLQRRMTDEGITFRQLLDDARQQLGRQMLADGANGIDEVAFLLGYQDTSSFYRAFRSWEGMTPAQWRELH